MLCSEIFFTKDKGSLTRNKIPGLLPHTESYLPHYIPQTGPEGAMRTCVHLNSLLLLLAKGTHHFYLVSYILVTSLASVTT